MTFATLLSSVDASDAARQQARRSREFPDLVSRSRLHLWRPGDAVAARGTRALVGVAPAWNNHDVQLLDVLNDALADLALSDLRVDVFDTDWCHSPADIDRFIPGLAGAMAWPLLGVWEGGTLRATASGHPARRQLLDLLRADEAKREDTSSKLITHAPKVEIASCNADGRIEVNEANDSIRHLYFCYRSEQRRRFMDGTLGVEWAERYPTLFDADDLRIYRTQCDGGGHFYEWLTAILLHEATGYLSLVEKYGAIAHPKKLPIWETVAPIAVQDLENNKGWPDLFMYAPDRSDWFFCEAKGASDRLSSEQRQCFQDLYRVSGKRVHVAWLKELRI